MSGFLVLEILLAIHTRKEVQGLVFRDEAKHSNTKRVASLIETKNSLV